ncbi:unnamed protein product [Auanema sp. JU1783]|nr:unnamed protein product [Auanema sp. JU1783]
MSINNDSWIVRGFKYVSNETQKIGIVPDTAILSILLIISLAILIICCFLRMFCCPYRKTKSPGSPYTRRELLCKKGLFALMLARLDEFDTLTPLILTPGASTISTEKTSENQNQNHEAFRFSSVRQDSESPPPPRRHQQGRTLIVPLNTSRYRAPLVPLLGTPDSRVTSIEGGTTKSCATIPECDEEVSPSCERIDDLVSIDRTSISASDQKSSRYYFSPSSYNLVMPHHPPEFQSSSSGFSCPLPVPTYSAPEIPRPTTLLPQRKTDDASSIGSPNSSLGTSPIDTTGSASDSFYINSDVISSTNGSVVLDGTACNDSDTHSKYLLHRIEEESEAVDDSTTGCRYPLNTVASSEMPRSISQQFEMMRRS